jgi:diguanylate cyclase (GGDEF)-like protein
MREFTFLMLAMSIHSLGYALELLSDTLEHMYLCIRIEYLGIAFYPFFILLFVSKYADENKVGNKFLITLMFTINVVTLVLVNTNSYHQLYYASMGVDTSRGFPILALKMGIWYLVQEISLFFTMIYAIIVLVIHLMKAKGDYQKKIVYMLIGVIVPVITETVYVLRLGPTYIDLTPFSYLVMTLCILFGLLRYDVLVLTPITYEMVLNSIGEAVLVVTENKILVNYNHASKEFFPSIVNLKVGESIQKIDELKQYDFESNPCKYEVNDKTFCIKMNYVQKNKVCIYVVNDVTEAELAKRKLEKMATEDGLTGLYNRRYFMENIESRVCKGTFAMIDIDFFKSINDTFGHTEGDKVLKHFGREIKQSFSEYIACRYGGEEFAVFFEDTEVNEAYLLVEKLREKISQATLIKEVTFSAGLAMYHGGNVLNVLDHADQNLYLAKTNGRNQTRFE